MPYLQGDARWDFLLGAVVQSFTVLVLHKAAELLGWELGPLEEGSWKVAGRKSGVGKLLGLSGRKGSDLETAREVGVELAGLALSMGGVEQTG